MSNVLIDEQNMYDIADAIREKTSTDDKLKPAEMAKKIEDINTDEWWENLLKTKRDFNYFFEKATTITFMPERICNLLNANPRLNGEHMWDGCSKLTRIDFPLHFSNGSSGDSMFRNCKSLEYIAELDMPNVQNVMEMFEGCNKLVKCPFSKRTTLNKANYVTGMYKYCWELVDAGYIELNPNRYFKSLDQMFTGCGKLVEVRFAPGCIDQNISFSACDLLSDESIDSIIEGLKTYTSSTSKTVTFSSDVVLRLGDERKQKILNKKWRIG